MASRSRKGTPAPDFTLHEAEGRPVSLTDFRGQNVVVLYFYPKDDTPGCTREACGFHDAYEDFTATGAVVIGVSADPPDRHRSFRSRHQLPFVLLSDSDGTVRKTYGVPKTLGLISGRVTFVIDRDGVIQHVFSSQFSPLAHIDEALEIVRKLAERGDAG